MEEALQSAELKAQNLEKVKNRMNGELEDLMLDLEKVCMRLVIPTDLQTQRGGRGTLDSTYLEPGVE